MNQFSNNKRTQKYNKKDLHIDSQNTLFIIDWDDTLYPTTWIVENNIDLTDPKLRYKYIKYFEHLDDQLSSALNHIITLGEIIIITNAMPEWIELSVSVLPKTKKCLRNIEVVSARRRYQNRTKMPDWKKYAFLEEVLKRIKKNKLQNILSLGDAEFEYNALLNLYKLDSLPHKYLKSIKFIRSLDYNVLIEQIMMIRQNISDLCKAQRHIDVLFQYDK
jgi:hypothetical protein